MTPEVVQFIADDVRQRDRDRYLCALLAPRAARGGLLALYAFDAELARIRSAVSETLIGRMRLQWWRDAVSAIFDGGAVPRGNPLLTALQACIAQHRLPRAEFTALFDARAAELEQPAEVVPDLAGLEAFAEGSGAPVTRLALHVLGAHGTAAETAARHVGTAWALTGLARAIVLHAADAGFAADDAITGRARALAGRAAARLDAAEVLPVPRAAVPALLPALIARGYLATLNAARFDPRDARIIRDRPNLLRLMWAAARGRI
ncbi:MAG: squalene/phytoene synthase family protein [Rhodospirillaceae bacterium]|nr:squalene/phytoene synthase family protein [Rhodospirillaceae bacterium]